MNSVVILSGAKNLSLEVSEHPSVCEWATTLCEVPLPRLRDRDDMYVIHLHNKFYTLPLKFPRVMFSTKTSGGRAKANATASATCVALIILLRGQSPATLSQISVWVAAG